LRLLMLVSEDWYFLSHRLPIARAARDAGMEVFICSRYRERLKEVEAEGFTPIPIELRRGSRNALMDLGVLWDLIRIYKKIKPDIAHHVAMKPSLYGTIAARVAGTPVIINAMAGLGHLFTSDKLIDRVSRFFVGKMFRLLFGSPRVKMLFQNQDDMDALSAQGAVSHANCVIIRGSGVDTTRFTPSDDTEKTKPPMVALVSRMLWTKGVGEFVAAARILASSGVKARFVLVGDADNENPAAIPERTLKEWDREGVTQWWGRREDIPQILSQASVYVLPSYREGLPKSLLEAAAAGLPLVAFDAPGCREVVRDGVNGYLAPMKDVEALAAAMGRLLADAQLRRRMGAESRKIALAEFDEKIVVGKTLDLYRQAS